MKSPPADDRPNDMPLPAGWTLLGRIDGAGMVVLDFQQGGRFGPRITAIGLTYEAALANGLDRMLLYDERDRQRGQL